MAVVLDQAGADMIQMSLCTSAVRGEAAAHRGLRDVLQLHSTSSFQVSLPALLPHASLCMLSRATCAQTTRDIAVDAQLYLNCRPLPFPRHVRDLHALMIIAHGDEHEQSDGDDVRAVHLLTDICAYMQIQHRPDKGAVLLLCVQET